ncbi:MAG: CopD family protein [Kofleriaceae bacterium]
MDPKIYDWLKAGHLIGDFLWVGSMFVVYWLLRFHTHAPKEAHEKLILMERSMALMMDLAVTLALGCGIALIFYRQAPYSSIFAEPNGGWFHIKLTVVVLGLLSIHGVLRGRIKKFQSGNLKPLHQWQWTVMLSSVVAVLVLMFVVRNAMNRAPAAAKPPVTAPAPANP